MKQKVAIVGGGAAGLMAAFAAAQNGNDVTLFERNPRPARKVMITGKGRCNVTNNCDTETYMANTPHGSRFMFSAFSAFSCDDTINFFESRGVPLKTERGNRVFPVSDKAVDIVDALVKSAIDSGVKIVNCKVDNIIEENGAVTSLKTENGMEFFFDKIILATGGMSYPVTGSTGDGYKFAENFGHTVTELRPSLVPIMIKEGFCTKLCGLSLKNVTLSLYLKDKKKPIFSELGEMMFTDFGITGPLVLSASAYIDKNPEDYIIKIDLKPGLDRQQLDKRIVRDFSLESNKDFINSLDALLPKRLISVIVRNTGIDPRRKVNSITKEERLRLVSEIKGLTLSVLRLRPIEEAVVTSGGVKLSEINPKTMESKLIRGLYFAGEIIDVDCFTGGFNLQTAFSTGYLAGISV
ncbi:MAG: NAD(P)/FAD-dependent oxidoreductase [Ruminococcaceae bacterium]|nr:NAD(P)/FAD-dependent oxidoreductase [Oscillospiraceae bacterium]